MIVYRCSECKDTEILIHGYLSWNPLTEEYNVEITDDIAYCKNCKQDVEILEQNSYSSTEERIRELEDISRLSF